ncbi:NAD(P)H-binding protein [Arthrobacter sp. ISL-95]|uniref:NAD(P)H-binding protein n=1 Tax=Arthrobacter sp. ISL-95 TaxID=2819116 RepID=UPI001BE71EB2|nr:NAD(P)H-binding protein [Arthrobacter sp. ISL-95]MBT2586424.1 NAD(P)H-binding protein [Arthrobacter sp. ISL-95]
MILVVGGTGRLGVRVTRDLAGIGQPFRIMARGRSQPFLEQGRSEFEVFRGTLSSASDCQHAVEGCEQVIFAASGFGLKTGGTPRSVDRDGALRLMEAAEHVGVRHMVMMSMYGAAADAPMEFLRMKYAAEEALRSSGMGWTIIRMGANLEQFLAVMSQPLETQGKVIVFGSGGMPVTFTSTADAAALAGRALSDPVLGGQTIEWGSGTYSLNELASAILANAGRGAIKRIPVPALRIMSVAARAFSPFMARMAAAALWMESGAAAFDPALQRKSLPDIPVFGLEESLNPSP